MKKIFLFVLFVSISFTIYGQNFIPLDKDTNEFIENVNFTLFLKNKVVFKGITENERATNLNIGVEFDSINLSRVDYQTLGITKQKINSSLFLSKKIISLDEIVVGSKKSNEIVLGETNRFVNRQSKPINKDLIYGVIFKNDLTKKVQINKMVFYINKITYKTRYKINFFEVTETSPQKGQQFLQIGNVLSSSDTLLIYPNKKKRIEVDINSEIYLTPNKPLFVSVQLINYEDEKNKIINPDEDKKTNIEFQLSNKTDYYSKGINYITKEMTPDLINVNRLINYDFANSFFKKPHKSTLVSPSFLLYTKKTED
ncbi:hypothetical protein [Flavobacterium aciduliphilum]|uniref:Uncharacterized protein n=1 Tax=Flavobacterium aciduliphilum TaxID=1101402 RepID=A0A328YPS8_9FLAO|nr:hypothetical protein [Flavobacterium aciduliphilum]RAR75610.1 hypothetical protein CLV55_101310 [Flavobacterium aciduliphilum]